MGRLRAHLFGISPREVTFARRGFRGGDRGARERLERIGATFLLGYHAALEQDEPSALAPQLHRVDAELQGFAFEGAAMGLALLDHLLPRPRRRKRLQTFLEGPGEAHIYMAHIGVGWVLARLRRRVEPTLARLDPVLRWLVVDGYGFHEGYFSWRPSVDGQARPPRVSGYARRVFDQGLGRSLWFVEGADVARIRATIGAFPLERRADLWSGVGLACAYAGAVARDAVEALQVAAGPYRLHLAQGAAFAAKARQRAGNPAPHTEFACQVLCGLPADTAANITDAALRNLPLDGEEPAYEIWRRRTGAEISARAARVGYVQEAAIL